MRPSDGNASSPSIRIVGGASEQHCSRISACDQLLVADSNIGQPRRVQGEANTAARLDPVRTIFNVKNLGSHIPILALRVDRQTTVRPMARQPPGSSLIAGAIEECRSVDAGQLIGRTVRICSARPTGPVASWSTLLVRPWPVNSTMSGLIIVQLL